MFIPNSVKVDIEDDLSDSTSDAVHAFPTEQQFNELCQRIGITHDHRVVIYDDQGIYSSPRIWWIFKSFGVENVFILDGGLPKWLREHKPVTADLITVITSYSIHYTKLYDVERLDHPLQVPVLYNEHTMLFLVWMTSLP